MNDDKELLELAAKAAGMEYLEYVREDYPNRAGLLQGNPNGRLFVWNPLIDDGDALRLAVKLGQEYGIDIVMTANGCSSCDVFAKSGCNQFVEDAADPYAATRRVIVHAAAEIGKGMK